MDTTTDQARTSARPARRTRSAARDVVELEQRVASLEQELAALRAELRTEVRTERFALVHPDDGRELIYMHRFSNAVSLGVGWKVEDDNFPRALITSSDEMSVGGDASVSVHAGHHGQVEMEVRVDAPVKGSDTPEVSPLLHLREQTWRGIGADRLMSVDAGGVHVTAGQLQARARFEVVEP